MLTSALEKHQQVLGNVISGIYDPTQHKANCEVRERWTFVLMPTFHCSGYILVACVCTTNTHSNISVKVHFEEQQYT
jgi:hypothetical protein